VVSLKRLENRIPVIGRIWIHANGPLKRKTLYKAFSSLFPMNDSTGVLAWADSCEFQEKPTKKEKLWGGAQLFLWGRGARNGSFF